MDTDSEKLEGLLKLREMREREAARTLAAASERADEAEREVVDRQRSLVKYRESREPQEQCLFDDFAQGVGDPAALERYRHGMTTLAHADRHLCEQIVEAQRQRRSAMQACAVARSACMRAVREREKLVPLVERYHDTARQAALRREEEEVEAWSTASGQLCEQLAWRHHSQT